MLFFKFIWAPNVRDSNIKPTERDETAFVTWHRSIFLGEEYVPLKLALGTVFCVCNRLFLTTLSSKDNTLLMKNKNINQDRLGECICHKYWWDYVHTTVASLCRTTQCLCKGASQIQQYKCRFQLSQTPLWGATLPKKQPITEQDLTDTKTVASWTSQWLRWGLVTPKRVSWGILLLLL